MRVIIIDDEPQSHQVLKEQLARVECPIHIVANGVNITEGQQLIEQHQPDLVFLDIELPDGLGFDLIRSIESPSFIVIFITAHNQYAQQAIRYGALDFLLKPIDFEELQLAISRAAKKQKTNISESQLQVMWEAFQQLQQNKLPTKIAISTTEGILYREMDTIIRLEAEKNYTTFHFINGTKSILASLNIGSFEAQFENHPHFMKVHRSSIINLKLVDKFVKADGGHLVMIDQSEVSVSRVYRNEVLRRLSSM